MRRGQSLVGSARDAAIGRSRLPPVFCATVAGVQEFSWEAEALRVVLEAATRLQGTQRLCAGAAAVLLRAVTGVVARRAPAPVL